MMKTSETIGNLAVALTKAQSSWPSIGKSAKGYGYKYAPLDVIIEAVRPVLTENDLAFVQMPGQSEHADQIVLTSRLIHSSGEFIEETMTIPMPEIGKANAAQCYGAGLTYARRYQLEAMLGIASTEDTDAVISQAPQAQPKPASKPKPQQVPNGNGLITDAQRKKLHAIGTELYGDDWNSKRADMSAAFNVGSSNQWTTQQAQRVIDGMIEKLNEQATKQADWLG